MSKPNDARPLKKQRTIPITPTGRWGGSLNVIDDDSLFLYGGESDEGFGKALGTTHLFSVSQQLWTVPTTSVTSTRVWHTTTTLPSLNALFIFGGESYDLEAPEILSSPMLYDLDNKLYYPPTLGRGKGPSKRSGHSACLINDDIVIFGGIARRSWLGDLYALNTTTWKWRTIQCVTTASTKSSPSTESTKWSTQQCLDPAPLPQARSYSTLTSLHNSRAGTNAMSGRALLFGGNDGTTSFNHCEILDTTRDNQWRWLVPTTSGAPPCPRTGHAACHVALADGRSSVLIHGGWDPQNSSSSSSSSSGQLMTFSDCFSLDVQTMAWSKVTFGNSISRGLNVGGGPSNGNGNGNGDGNGNGNEK